MNKKNFVLFVENIEPSLRFWVDALGFEMKASVINGKSLEMVTLTAGNAEVKLQTYASQEKKNVYSINKLQRIQPSVLYVEVLDIKDIECRLSDFDIIIPRRKTFYNTDEIFFCSPGGYIVGFAQRNRR